MSEAFEISVRSIPLLHVFSSILFLKTSKTCEFKEFLFIVNCVGFIIIYLFKCCSDLSLNAIPSLFSLLQGEVHSKQLLLLFVCCCSYFFKFKLYNRSGYLDFRIINCVLYLFPTFSLDFHFSESFDKQHMTLGLIKLLF